MHVWHVAKKKSNAMESSHHHLVKLQKTYTTNAARIAECKVLNVCLFIVREVAEERNPSKLAHQVHMIQHYYR